MKQNMESLVEAKGNVEYLLVHADASVDMHGLTYWASEVERLREEIKKEL